MKKLVLLISAIVLSLGPTVAFAAETQLTWERSQMQQVIVDSAIAESLSSLSLLGQGESLQFTASPNLTSNGSYIFQVLIPVSFPLGTYSVNAVMNDGSVKNLSLIRVVEYQSQSYNPLTDPETVATLSIAFFSILAMWGISDSPTGRHDDYQGDQTTFDGADGGAFGRRAAERRDFRRGLISSIYLDQLRSVATITFNKFSPLFSRLVSDGSYLQYSLGSAVLIFPLLGALLGGLAFQDIQGVGGISTPSFAISATIIVLGALDAGSGFIASVVFGLCALTSHRFQNIYDLRTYMGMSILWFTPSLIANATRALRESRKDSNWWERMTDVVVGSLITGWTVRCLTHGLDGFAHLKLPLGKQAATLGAIASIVIAIRYLIEGYVNKKSHYYMAYLSPRNVNKLHPNFRLIGWFIKGLLFLFFAVSFLGATWQLWLGLTFVILPNVVKVARDKFPNSSALFQILPVGIPALVFMTILGKIYYNFIHSLNLDPASASRTIFVLAPIPGFVIGLLRHFGREPKAGDQRWYMRSNLTAVYRSGGVVLLCLYGALTFGLVG